MKKNEIKYWGRNIDERLYYHSADEAIEAILDQRFSIPLEDIDNITVYEYAPIKISLHPGFLLDFALETLDEEYGDPEAVSTTEPTESMKKAEKELIDIIIAQYPVWPCEPTGHSVTVNSLEWVKKHHPDGLKYE